MYFTIKDSENQIQGIPSLRARGTEWTRVGHARKSSVLQIESLKYLQSHTVDTNWPMSDIFIHKIQCLLIAQLKSFKIKCTQ